MIDWAHRHIGELNETSLKHRSHILLLSVLLLFVSSDIVLILGKASLAGLGISVDPPQTIPVGLFLFVILVYRVIAFWTSALINNGLNIEKIEHELRLDYDPIYEAEPKPRDPGELARVMGAAIRFKWERVKVLWEFYLPNLFAFVSIANFVFDYYSKVSPSGS